MDWREEQPNWYETYVDEAKRLGDALRIDASSIADVGSTAIPDIMVKPVLDIAIVVNLFDVVDEWLSTLEHLDYHYKELEANMPQRRFFTKGPEGRRTVYLHIVDAQEFAKLTAFRDALLADKRLAAEFKSEATTRSSQSR